MDESSRARTEPLASQEASPSQRPLRLRDALTALGLITLAAATRWPMRTPPAYWIEGFHFAAARELGIDSPLVSSIYSDVAFPLRGWFWGQPLFHAFVHVADSFSEARTLVLLVGSLLPALAYLILAALGVRFPYRATVGLLVATMPVFVVYGSLVLPYAAMLVPLAAAVLFHVRHQPALAAACLAAALLTDRLAAVTGAVLLGVALRETIRFERTTLWPLTLDARSAGYLVAIVGSLIPLSYAGDLPLALRDNLSYPEILTRCVGSLWLLPGLVVALALPRSRPLALIPLVHLTLFLLVRATWGYSPFPSQFLPSLLFFMVALAVAAEELTVRLSPRVAWRRITVPATAALAAIILALPFALSTTGIPADVATPGAPNAAAGRTDITGLIDLARPAVEAAAQVDASRWDRVFLVDVDLSYAYHPFLYRMEGGRVVLGYTGAPLNITSWSTLVETEDTLTVVRAGPEPLNAALRGVYSDCVIFDNAGYVLLDAEATCQGRGDRLRQQYLAAAADGEA